MPTYLIHGFRWPRNQIRIHVILQNIDDAAPEWLIAPKTTAAMLHSFRTLWPETMSALPNLRFVEQYDPLDEVNKSQPYAYVADVVEEIPLSADIDDIRGRGVSNEQWAALMELRDQLAKDAKVSWYVVVCGDEDRYVPSQSGSVYSQEEDTEVETTPPRSVLRSAGSRVGLFAGSSSKTTQHSSPPIREKTSSTPGGARTPTPSSSHRPTMSAESRSSRANTPAMTRTATSESTRAAEPSRGKQRERPPEVRRERSGSLGRLGRIFGVKESKSNRNLRQDSPPPPMPRKKR